MKSEIWPAFEKIMAARALTKQAAEEKTRNPTDPSLYDVHRHSGEDTINEAHPDGGTLVAESYEPNGGLVETQLEQQERFKEVATKTPHGTHVANTINELVKLANDLEEDGKEEASSIVDEAIQEIVADLEEYMNKQATDEKKKDNSLEHLSPEQISKDKEQDEYQSQLEKDLSEDYSDESDDPHRDESDSLFDNPADFEEILSNTIVDLIKVSNKLEDNDDQESTLLVDKVIDELHNYAEQCKCKEELSPDHEAEEKLEEAAIELLEKAHEKYQKHSPLDSKKDDPEPGVEAVVCKDCEKEDKKDTEEAEMAIAPLAGQAIKMVAPILVEKMIEKKLSGKEEANMSTPPIPEDINDLPNT